MTEAAKKARAAYLREWRKKHREATKRQNESYWERIAKQQADYAKEQQGEKHDI